MANTTFTGISPLPSYVGGKAFTGSGSFKVHDPHSKGKVLHTVSSVTAADVPKVIEAAKKAFPTWKKTSVLERRRIVSKAAALLKERIGDYAAIEAAETTSTGGWAGFDCHLAIEGLEETAATATVALRGEVATTEAGQRGYITRCPYGIVFGSAPWNAPLVLSQRACIQPIIGGNVAILKTSEISPRTQLILADIFAEAGLPEGVLNIIHVAPADAPAVAEAIISDPAVGKINFTGSTRVGSIIAQLAGKYIKPVVLELGGKAPVVVTANADLEAAAAAIRFGGFFHSGQICMATQTAIVHESVADKLLAIIQAGFPLEASGDSSKGAPLRGLFTQASADRVKGIIDDALTKGATIGAGKNSVEGNVVQPLLLTDVTPEMAIYKTEMFAPVFSLLTYTDEADAIAKANDHEYGLAAAVFTKIESEGFRIAEGIDAGMVHINGSSVHDCAQIPHGGWKSSGFGRFNGIEGIREFTQTKVITVNDPHPYPL